MTGRRKSVEYVETEAGCYECSSHALGTHGYPILYKDGRPQNMHRVLYEEAFGPLPAGMVVRHKCDNRACIRLDHLESGTWAENSNDCKERGRLNTPRGSSRSDTKLPDEQVREIRLLDGVKSQSQIAAQFGVSQPYVSRIMRGEKRRFVR